MRRIQLDFIDGLRALSALYIVANHSAQFLRVLPASLHALGHGPAVVSVFITISGFCLAIPQASSQQWTLDAAAFYRRRARRILPPYFAALVLAIVVAVGFKLVGPFRDPVFDLTTRQTLAHVFLIQNWLPSEMYTLDGPLWSIAVECQIYLLYPLMVLLRRRYQWYGVLAASVGLSFLSFKVFRANGQTQFLAFFALGVLSAEIAYGKKRRWLPLGILGITFLAWFRSGYLTTLQEEGLFCIATAACLAYLVQQPGSAAGRLLGWRPLVRIGLFSYSIYLVHALVLSIAWYWIRDRQPEFGAVANPRFAVTMTLLGALTVLASYMFHLMFEKPFLSKKRKAIEERLAVT